MSRRGRLVRLMTRRNVAVAKTRDATHSVTHSALGDEGCARIAS